MHSHLTPVAVAALLLPALLVAQGPETGSAASMIADATSAAPSSIAAEATVMAWPAEEGGEFRVLREGTNDWVCYPTTPTSMSVGRTDPLCLDRQWQQWAGAYFAGTEPALDGVGVAYMLAGDAGSSNTDPFATRQAPDNHWVVTGPHLMLVVPDPALLASAPTDPTNGGPWVMWAGTPYAHLMIPLEGPGTMESPEPSQTETPMQRRQP